MNLGPEPTPRTTQRLIIGTTVHARGVCVSPNHGAVQQQPLQIGILHGLEYPLPDTLPAPVIKSMIDGVPFPEPLGQIPPRDTSLRHIPDSIDEVAVVLGNTPVTATTARQ